MTDAKLPAKTPRALVPARAPLPVLLLAGILSLLFARGTGLYLEAPAPIEKLEFGRVVLEPGLIRVHVINTGPEPLTIAQTQVGWISRASWEFEVAPSATIPRLGRAVVRIPRSEEHTSEL